MTNVQRIINRQFGNYFHKSYDSAIMKLRCTKQDDHIDMTWNRAPDKESPVFVCKFANRPGYEHLLALANEDGYMSLFNTETRDPNRLSVLAHHNAIFDLAWMHNELEIVTASGDHTVRIFDVGGDSIRPLRIFVEHTRSVKTVACRKNDTAVFATGARDGVIFIWDKRSLTFGVQITKPDGMISQSHSTPLTPGSRARAKRSRVSPVNSVTGLVFQNDTTLISCGSNDGIIKVWDLRKTYSLHKHMPLPKYTLPYAGHSTRNGFTNLLIDNSGLKLYANCMDNYIYCYNIATYEQEPVMTYYGHQNSSFYVKSSISVDGNYLISGSGDSNAYIWNVKNPMPLACLTGHTAEVTSVAWCQKDSLKVVTCGDDMKHKIWTVHADDEVDDWKLEGCGAATNWIGTPVKTRKRTIMELENTPTTLNRSKICVNCRLLTSASKEKNQNCENCISAPVRSHKRNAPDDSTVNTTSEKKRSSGGARCLFGENQKTFSSPTANLPNFVLDGIAPHLNYSPPKKQDRDWLTKMRIEQSLRQRMESLSQPSSPKQRRLNDSPSSDRKSKQKNHVQSPIDKFFRSTGVCERHCRSPTSPVTYSLPIKSE